MNLADTLTLRLKRLRYLIERTGGSVKQRGLKATVTRITQEFRPRPALDTALDIEPADASPTVPGHLPSSEHPAVSVIIPVHGKLAYTLACLRSIARHGAGLPFEVIIVDDASPDDSADVLANIPGLRLLRNTQNLGFVGSCNRGAQEAHGKYLLFLNNDTQVLPGWLDALHEALQQHRQAAIAGSQLIYPDGRLQEAGAYIASDGSAWNYGRFESRHDPRFAFLRPVDYVSGAALMIAREQFLALGGFDARYAPAYYEDADLCTAARAQGRKVLYVPASRIVHCEGISAGTDLGQGMKRYQATNQARYVQKWTRELATQPAPNTPFAQRDSVLEPRHLLVIDAATPDARRDSGSLRLMAIFQLLARAGWRLAFAPADGHADARHVAALGALGVEVVGAAGAENVPAWLARHGDTLSAAMLCRAPVAAQYIDLLRRRAPKARVLFDTVDLHFLREGRAAELSGQKALARQAERSRQRELSLLAQADVSFVVSAYEQQLLADACPQAKVLRLSNIHRVQGRGPDFAPRAGVLFIGGYAHPPNTDAIDWLVAAVMPALRRRQAGIVLHLVGDMPEARRKALAADDVIAHGRVDDLRPLLDTCRLSVAPLRFGAGVKGKINTAMSHGLPVVATTMAAEGMGLIDGQDVCLADDADALAEAIVRVHEDAALWQRLSEGGLTNIQAHFSEAAAAATLAEALHDPAIADATPASAG
ncbi:glycosyltransferase [Oleiagrimonas sp. C23AA]|uniref:glycosyltransferase n=1 Tax=Oleiagrimonas sp. C23AA TaxID=2719047 RepID=UPI001421254C|nr:glycosyltransferase [Oleiagrimonas sp. C23AA]NII10040.1 glycosyltransferase [Oleiagrimonas sp. C23AA]